jgi:hypothetical protein
MLDATKNRLFHEKCRNIARELLSLGLECDRQAEYFVAQIQGQAAFVDTDIATVAELTALFGVVNAFRTFMAEGAVAADALRRDKLMPFVAE